MSVTGNLTRVKIIAIGDELLEGRTADTNSQRIQRALGGHAVQVGLIQVVPDTEIDIRQALDRTEAGDLVFISGGLGSTPDDTTRRVVADWAGAALIEDAALRTSMEERWRRRGITAVAGVLEQCQVPAGMVPLRNPVGSAPGLAGALSGRTVVMLPGVPAELEGLLPGVVAWLLAQAVLPAGRPSLLWRTAQASELSLVRSSAALRERHDALLWSWWLTDWGVDIRVAAPAADLQEQELAVVGEEMEAILGPLVYSRRMDTLPQVVQRLLTERGQTLAVAESCTGGMIGARLTDEPGSSAFFRGGVLAYADEVKIARLGVPAATLTRHGAVSEATVRAMAAGCRERFGTDYALAVSGISGPGGGTEDKPVGTTWVALATPQNVFAGHYRFPADRNRNRLLTVGAAVDTLRRVLTFREERSPWADGDTWARPA